MLGRHEPDPSPDPPAARREPPPRIISFGVRTVEIEGRRGQPGRRIEIEGGCDAAHTSRTYWRYVGPNEPWHQNDVSDQPNTKVLETGITMRRRDPKRAGDGKKTDVITKFPPLTEAQWAAASVLRGIVGEH